VVLDRWNFTFTAKNLLHLHEANLRALVSVVKLFILVETKEPRICLKMYCAVQLCIKMCGVLRNVSLFTVDISVVLKSCVPDLFTGVLWLV